MRSDIDGEIGPLTLAAAVRAPIEETLHAYADVRRARYRALPHFWRFGRGWLARVDTTLSRALGSPRRRGQSQLPSLFPHRRKDHPP